MTPGKFPGLNLLTKRVRRRTSGRARVDSALRSQEQTRKLKSVNTNFKIVFALLVAPNRAKLTLMVARKPMIFCFVLFYVTLVPAEQ